MKCVQSYLMILSFLLIGFSTMREGYSQAYKIGEGDVLHIQVLDESEFTGKFRVGSDGSVDYPYLRNIPVTGKTTDELRDDLRRRLQDGYLADPQVIIDVAEYRSQKVLVLGAVAKPGTYILKDQTRVLDVISTAGGITDSGGKKILLVRGGNISATLENPQSPSDSSDLQKDPLPKQDDPETSQEENLAEGPLQADTADQISSKMQDPIVIDYYQLVHKGDLSQNLILQEGDILNVPKANEIFVLGSVGKPGPVKFDENMTILEAVTLAGGTLPTASTKSTYILRQEKNGEKKISVRFDRILSNKEKNVRLSANDVIVVPESFF